MREDGMRDQLENAAQEAERHGRLPSAADVMRRGDRRRTRATATRAVAAALIVVAGGGGWWLAQDGPDRGTPAPPATASPDPSPTPDDVAPTQPAVTFQAPDGSLLTTRTEPGVELAAPEDVAGPTMALWYTEATSTPDTFVLRNGAEADGKELCLQIPAEGTVFATECDAAASDQSFLLSPVEGSAYTLSTDLGYVVAEADGSLTTSTDPADATPFTVADPDDPGTVPDL